MKIRLWSDIHLEFGDMKFTEREDDKETVLIIAGDFQTGSDKFDFLRELCPKFRAVLYTCGNHEYYGRVYHVVNENLQALADEIENFHFLNPGRIVIDDTLFIGATLWTDLNKNDPMVMEAARYAMNDYRRIKFKYQADGDAVYPITPAKTCSINAEHRKYICEQIDLAQGSGQKIVVFTHHPPLEECAKNKFYQPGDPLTFAYCNTGLEEWIAKCNWWFHGHVHAWNDIEFHGCRIVSRPRGYIGYENEAYHYDLTSKDAEVIEL